MKLITTLATVALLWAGAVKADGFATSIEQAYSAAGYSNIVVQHVHGNWLVTADLAGVTHTFLVDRETGASTAVDPNVLLADDDGSVDDNGVDGAGHDVGDDHGVDGAGHDVGDDHGSDSAGHDVGDDNGSDGAGHDAGDDHGSDSSGHDAGDDHGGNSHSGKGGSGKSGSDD